MPQISLKKLFVVILGVVLLSQLPRIVESFYEAFEPLRDSPPLSRYIAALLFLGLVWVTIYFLLLNRNRK